VAHARKARHGVRWSRLHYQAMGSFERFTTKAHFNSLKRLVLLTALATTAVKLLVTATTVAGGSPLDLLARLPAGVADLAAALLVFEVLMARRAVHLAARTAALVAASPVLFVASGVHGDHLGVAVLLLLLAVHLLVDRQAPLLAGIILGLAGRVEPLVLLAVPVVMAAVAAPAEQPPDAQRAARSDRSGRRRSLVQFGLALAGALLAGWVPALAWDWPSLQVASGAPQTPGGLGPAWLLHDPDRELIGFLLGRGRPLVLAAAVVPAVLWVRRRPRRVYAAVGLTLLTPLALAPAWSPRDLAWPVVFGYLGDARWASIYSAAAGATLLWTSTWWGGAAAWDGGLAPGAAPAGGAAAVLGLATWMVLLCWLALGWRTVAVEAGRPSRPAPAPGGPAEAVAGAGGRRAGRPEASPGALAPPGGL
jgi:hypothetical protein